MDTKKIAVHFSRHAHDYEQLSVMQRDIADKVAELIPDRDYRTILDVGCGTGYLCRELRQRFPSAQVTGVDIAHEMIRVASAADPEGTYICRDFTGMAFPDGKYDLIVSTSALHWTDDVSLALEKYRAFCDIMAYATFVSPSLEVLRQAFVHAYEVARLPYREHVLCFPDEEQLPCVVGFLEYVKDYHSWLDVLKSIKAIGGNYTLDNRRPYINRTVVSALKSFSGAQLKWRVALGLSGNCDQ